MQLKYTPQKGIYGLFSAYLRGNKDSLVYNQSGLTICNNWKTQNLSKNACLQLTKYPGSTPRVVSDDSFFF